MTTPPSPQDLQDQFAHCVQVFGGVAAASRRLGIDERALRRFVNGERPITAALLKETAQVLRNLIAQATEVEANITAAAAGMPADQ